MTRIPEPTQTPRGPAYEGRLLDRPDDEVVDQGVAFDVRTLLSRRGLLSVVGLGAGAAVLAACAPTQASSPTHTTLSPVTPSATPSASASPSATAAATASALPDATEIPDETAGPYPGDGSNGPDVLAESGIVRSDLRTSISGGGTADGVPLTFTITVLDLAGGGGAFTGAAVYAWHCDAQGRYSMYSSGIENETFLRGVQVVGDDGTVTFTSIFPGCYSGRWPHIHFEVYPTVDAISDASNAIATSQMALPQTACDAVYADSRYSGSAQNLAQIGSLTNDNVFGDDGGVHQLAAATGSVGSGYTATLIAPVDIRTEPTGGGMGGPPRG